MIHNFYNTES